MVRTPCSLRGMLVGLVAGLLGVRLRKIVGEPAGRPRDRLRDGSIGKAQAKTKAEMAKGMQ